MSKYVIRFGLGVDNTKVFLKVTGNDFDTSTLARSAIEFQSRKEATDIQKWLLQLPAQTLNTIIHKDKAYTDHVSISVMQESLNVRNKLYLYNPEV